MRKSHLAALAACALLGAPATSHAIVGGTDVPAGQHKNVAEIVLGMVAGCTGTLIAPDWVMTAGHCGSLTGGVGVAQPVASFPPQTIDVYLGSNKPGAGTRHAVSAVHVQPQYLLRQGYDISLLRLSAPVTGIAPTPLAGPSDRFIWEPGDMQTIVGWGALEWEGPSADTLQVAQVPIVSDADCEKAYGKERLTVLGYQGFEPVSQVCAGYPQGGIDSCQGDSGGPMFATNAAGQQRLTGATSYGNECARPGFPGVYARIGDAPLRTWVGSLAPAALAP